MRRMFLSIVLVSAIVMVPHLAFSQSELTASDKPYQMLFSALLFDPSAPPPWMAASMPSRCLAMIPIQFT